MPARGNAHGPSIVGRTGLGIWMGNIENRAEALFRTYLEQAGKPFTREPQLGGLLPDFLVDEKVVCEITSIEKDHLPAPGQVGSRDAPKPLRDKITRKWKQAEASRVAGYPFVLVVDQEGLNADLSRSIAEQALFGDVTITMTLDPDTGIAHNTGPIYGERGKTEPTGHTNLSALGLMRTFNPTLVELEREMKTRWTKPDSEDWPSLKLQNEYVEIHVQAQKDLIAAGKYDPDMIAIRLIIFHTRQPELPLTPGWLGGIYDEEYSVGPDGTVKLVHSGPELAKVPGAPDPLTTQL